MVGVCQIFIINDQMHIDFGSIVYCLVGALEHCYNWVQHGTITPNMEN